MTTSEFHDALNSLAHTLGQSPDLSSALLEHWSANHINKSTALPLDVRNAAELVATALSTVANGDDNPPAGDSFIGDGRGAIVLSWCSANAWRDDVTIAPILKLANTHTNLAGAVKEAARKRVISGPLHDALSCAPLTGAGSQLDQACNSELRARLDILLWEAGACALEVPNFGEWLWNDVRTFESLVGTPAQGSLRGRVLAARCLEVSVSAIEHQTNQELVGRTLQVLQPLLLHPEPLVWVHAARALGRLTGSIEQLQGMLLDWVMGDSPVLRQRAITAFASLPADRLGFLASQLVALVTSPDEDGWVLAAIAAATPYLYFERRDIWDRLAKRIYDGEGGAITARALARGLGALWRRGTLNDEIEPYLRQLRTHARRTTSSDISEMRRWLEVVAATDVIDRAERDPLDLEVGLDNLMRLAAQYDDPEADARAARFAEAIEPTFQEAHKIVVGATRLRQRAAAINGMEACARAFAMRMWSPLLATSPYSDPIDEPDLEQTWHSVASAPAQLLDLVQERRQLDSANRDADVCLEALAIRLGGYALDACGEDNSLGPGSGPTTHDTCLWLRKLEGLTDGSRDLPPEIETALSAIFWRLVDTTRGTTLGETDDVAWLGPFAAWWALVIDRPAVLERLTTALPMMETRALEHCCSQAKALRDAISANQEDGTWQEAASHALAALHAQDTELAHALASLAESLANFSSASGNQADLEQRCLELVLSGDRLQAALADPVKALHVAVPDESPDSLARKSTENAPRRAALMARSIRLRDPSMLEVWLASLGPIASALMERTVQSAIGRTPPPPPHKKKKEPKIIAGYELIKSIGEGGIGSIWLVRKPGANRMFVLKIPKAEALANASETEAKGILESFVEEAAALAGLYHPNVASIIDRGVVDGAPFLVLEYLIGADLKQYSQARLMSLFELRDVVLGACAGLEALHRAGLVHRDIKPANLWLRLPLGGGKHFDPGLHREPAAAPPLATVVIDFGMVRAVKVSDEAAGRFVAGTAGYIAPEQVLDPVELSPRADVYAMAGTIYNVTTGRTFFDEIENNRERIIAHMNQDPFEDASRLKPYPREIAKLLRAATAQRPEDRPAPLEFGRAFADAL